MAELYIMEVSFLQEERQYEAALHKIDRTRREKIERYAKAEDRYRGIGAGILLQYAVKKQMRFGSDKETAVMAEGIQAKPISCQHRRNWNLYRIDCEPEKMEEPVSIDFVYGKEGKPYLQGYSDCYVSISHSGQYVICAVAETEVGADIQEIKAETGEKISKRFYTREEQAWLTSDSQEERRRRFYRLWAAKESYVKLTGQGLARGTRYFTADLERQVIIDEGAKKSIALTEVPVIPGYVIFLCRYGEKYD